MFAWLWGRAWSALAEALGGQAKTRASKALSALRGLRESITNELAQLIGDSGSLGAMGFLPAATRDGLGDPHNPDSRIELQTVPMEFFSKSPVLAKKLAAKLKSDVDLGALKNKIGATTDEWNSFLDQFASAFVEFYAPRAIQQLVESGATFYGNDLVVAVAEGEGYKLNGVDGYHDMVKIFAIPGYKNRDDEVKRARRLWKRRTAATYRRNL